MVSVYNSKLRKRVSPGLGQNVRLTNMPQAQSPILGVAELVRISRLFA